LGRCSRERCGGLHPREIHPEGGVKVGDLVVVLPSGFSNSHELFGNNESPTVYLPEERLNVLIVTNLYVQKKELCTVLRKGSSDGRQYKTTYLAITIMKITLSQLRKIIEEEVDNTLSRLTLLGFGESPDPQDVHGAFLKLRNQHGEVPIQKLANELGVSVNRIDFNGTGLRALNTIVTKLL